MAGKTKSKTGSATLIYDGDCAFCMASVRWLKRRSVGSGLEYLPYQAYPYPMTQAGLTAQDCIKAAYVIEQRGSGVKAYRGAGAVNYALRRSRGHWSLGWRFLGGLYLLPGIRQIQNLGYRWVADNRFRLSTSGDSCSVEEPTHE